jgi:hypothetical protein
MRNAWPETSRIETRPVAQALPLKFVLAIFALFQINIILRNIKK